MIKEELIKSIIERYTNKMDLLYADTTESAQERNFEALWYNATKYDSTLDSLLDELGDLIND